MAHPVRICDSRAMPPLAVPDFSPLTADEVDGLPGVHVGRLAAVPCHGNLVLTPDRLFQGLLPAQFDPMVRSLRLIEGCGDFNGRLDLGRMARSTTSDALAACDPGLLAGVVYAGMERLIGTSRNGITYQLHIAVISVLLMYVRSGTRVSIYALAVFSRVANGTMTLEAAVREIAKRERERLINRARQARKRAEKKSAA